MLHEIEKKIVFHEGFITDRFDMEIEQNIQSQKYKVRYWSYVLPFIKNGVCYYAKIPKAIATSSDIFYDILDERNKLIALNEMNYLIELNRLYSNANSNLQVVELVGYSSKMNAVITKKVEGPALYDLSRSNNSSGIINYYSSIGSWLKYFHQMKVPIDNDSNLFQTIEEKEIKDLFEWLSVYCNNSYLQFNAKLFIPKFLQERQKKGLFAYTLGGFEVRNFLINRNGSVCFLDPTEIMLGSKLDDIARFIVSIDMIPWGHFDAYITRDYSKFKEAFLKSYFGDEYQILKNLLLFYILKWLLIRWRESCLLLNEFKINAYKKSVIQKYYSDYLFKKWINMYLRYI